MFAVLDSSSGLCMIGAPVGFPARIECNTGKITRNSMTDPIELKSVGQIPFPGDNAAIASRRLESGIEILGHLGPFQLSHGVLEGHRFAITGIPKGQFLLSWGLPFGTAVRDIAPGEYVCNARILQALRSRNLAFSLPVSHNFDDHLVRYQLDEQKFSPGTQLPRHAVQKCFPGIDRGVRRGVGTRNFIVVMGTSSRTASFARALAERFSDVPSRYRQIDGVVAVAHTEGGGLSRPNNLEFVLRALAGFMVHPNVAAILAVDSGTEPVNNRLLKGFLTEHQYPIDDVPHQFLTLGRNFQSSLSEGVEIVQSWLREADGYHRSSQSIGKLRIALQCGGSDAFSGVSGNPLAGWVAKELIRFGGSANLAETDELIGAESYLLQNVRDLETSRRFLQMLDQFQERAGWHGHDAEGNPSGGNNYRGLYNIAIKSIGAARKKDPEVCLDYVIEYGERMELPGFYFMDSPGNDLESVAGQVAAGCNLILFTTGNGSITNFPFVPTMKIMTSTARYALLSKEMDVNAGRHQDGTSMESLGAEVFETALRVSGGELTAGERAGHSQVQIWRDWRQTSHMSLKEALARPQPDGEPIPLGAGGENLDTDKFAHNPDNCGSSNSERHTFGDDIRFSVYESDRGLASDRVGLIVPTSLCAGQIAKMIAGQLNRADEFDGFRFVALTHTEGCGASGGECEELFKRTMAGYLMHPFSASALLLEHGCEKTHNDAMRECLGQFGLDSTEFGWASIQLDGGIDSVILKVQDWFRNAVPALGTPRLRNVGLESLRLGLTASGSIPEVVASTFAVLVRAIVSAGGVVVVPAQTPLIDAKGFSSELFEVPGIQPSLAYGETFRKPGFHVMETPTDHQMEILTGLGATGIETVVSYSGDFILQAHPLIPLIQIGGNGSDDLDLTIDSTQTKPNVLAELILRLAAKVAAREYTPKLCSQGNTDFQITRGLFGLSL